MVGVISLTGNPRIHTHTIIYTVTGKDTCTHAHTLEIIHTHTHAHA